MPENLKIAVCMTVYNRKTKTLACLRSLFTCTRPKGTWLNVYLVDDASTDGTAEAVASEFPDVTVIPGKGDLYWAGGMRLSFSHALRGSYDYFLWMNDDVELEPHALQHLIETEQMLAQQEGRRSLVSGAMWDPRSGAPSYGARQLIVRHKPRSIMIVPHDEKPLHGDLLNANFLIIPNEAARAIGNIPVAFRHSLADWDYSLRANLLGFGTYLASGYVGRCYANPAYVNRWGGQGLSLIERYRKIFHPLGLHPRTRGTYLIKHFRLLGWLYLLSPYIKLPLDHLTTFRRPPRSGVHTADETAGA